MSTSVIASGDNFTAISTCKFDDLMSMKGKVFVKDQVNATGSEISLSMLPPGQGIPFLHSHKQNEEIYIVIKGTGQFMCDSKVFDIKEGDVIRVAPNGARSIRASEKEPLIYICSQSKAGSLEQYAMGDGNLIEGEVKW